MCWAEMMAAMPLHFDKQKGRNYISLIYIESFSCYRRKAHLVRLIENNHNDRNSNGVSSVDLNLALSGYMPIFPNQR